MLTISEEKKREISEDISRWIQSTEGKRQIDEARCLSNALIKMIDKQNTIDPANLKKPFTV